MHHCHSIFQSFLGSLKADLLAVQVNMACILVVNTEQALHKSGLTGSVLAHKSMNRSGTDRQGNIIQGLYAGE